MGCFIIACIVVLGIIGLGIYAWIKEEKESTLFCFIISTLIVLATICFVHKCPNCGHLSIGADYCKDCGQVVENSYWLLGERRKCPVCDAHVGKKQKYCTKCGRELRS